MKKKLKHKIKFDDVKDSKAEIIELDPEDAMRYVDRAIEINKGLNTTESKSQLRLNIQLDQFRHQVHPDDLECFLYDLNRQASKAFWARGEKQTDTSILASVLTPLPKETGFAIGDMIELKLYKYKDSTRLIHVMSHEI